MYGDAEVIICRPPDLVKRILPVLVEVEDLHLDTTHVRPELFYLQYAAEWEYQMDF
jgi:hypothetical protein